MKILIIISIVFFLFPSCKKDNVNSSNILISKVWKKGLNDKNTSSNPSGKVIYYAVLSCEQDDTYKFDSNGTLILNRATDKCDQAESQTETQNYTINKATKELTINGRKFTLAEESSSQIKYFAPVPSASGYDYIIYLLH